MRKTIGALMAAVSAVAFTAGAEAYEFTPYAGVNYNYSQVGNHDRSNLNSASVMFGTDYNKYFGTEVFYQYSDSDQHKKVETSFRSYGLDAYGYLPLGCEQKFALLGTAGIANYDFKTKVPMEKRHGDNGLGYRLGAGAQYNIDQNLAVRAVARYVWTDKIADTDHITEYTAGIKYNF